ncbi:MAG: tetratricopeptide repeat protein [Candidatus Sulfotelmatobacter sp.]
MSEAGNARTLTHGGGKLQHKDRTCTIASFLAFALAMLLSSTARAQDNPTRFDDVVLRAAAARDQNDVPQAIELYRQAVELKPEWPDGWWFLGSLQYSIDAYASARDALTHYLQLTPDAGPAAALRGLCEFETGEYAQSLKDLQRGLSLGAGNQSRNEKILRYHEALLLTRTGNFEGALQKYALFARDKVPNPELLVAVGLAGLRTPLMPKELKVDQQELYAAVGKAALRFMAGDRDVAQQEFQQLFQRYPAQANLHYLYGYLLFPTDPDQGTVEFKRELDVAPANAAAQLMVAWDALIRNEPSEALVYAQKAMAEEPTTPIAQLVLGRALLDTGDAKGGTELLEKELQHDPDNLETHIALAKAYSKTGRKEDARRERMRCLELEKNENPVVHP